jgi:DNA-binding MarR family transcriptional regulator
MSTASRPRPRHAGAARPANIVVLLREAYVTLNDQAIVRLADSGHEQIRPAHSAVFEYLDDTGTTVSRLAERAQMTKQAMAELVAHLEKHGYVERRPDPDDRRAKLVVPTGRGHEVLAIAQALVPEVEQQIVDLVGPRRAAALRADLERICHRPD